MEVAAHDSVPCCAGQGVAAVLAAAQIQIGIAVNIRVVEQGFSPGSDDNEIDDLIESLELATNAI